MIISIIGTQFWSYSFLIYGNADITTCDIEVYDHLIEQEKKTVNKTFHTYQVYDITQA